MLPLKSNTRRYTRRFSAPTQLLVLAEFCLMHRNIMARFLEATLNGGSRALVDIRACSYVCPLPGQIPEFLAAGRRERWTSTPPRLYLLASTSSGFAQSVVQFGAAHAQSVMLCSRTVVTS